MRVAGAEGRVLPRFVVVSHYVEGGLEAVVAGPDVVEAGGDGAGAVLLAGDAGEAGGEAPADGVALLDDLVADAPHHDGRVVAVAADHGAEVGLVPPREIDGVVVLLFRNGPGVEGLDLDEEAHAVAEIEQLGGGGIVGGADGVDAHVAQ